MVEENGVYEKPVGVGASRKGRVGLGAGFLKGLDDLVRLRLGRFGTLGTPLDRNVVVSSSILGEGSNEDVGSVTSCVALISSWVVFFKGTLPLDLLVSV